MMFYNSNVDSTFISWASSLEVITLNKEAVSMAGNMAYGLGMTMYLRGTIPMEATN